MTRDEAINKIDELGTYRGENFIDALTVLGMLTLDEPKSIEAKIAQAIGEYGMVSPAFALKALDAAGLKIVEK